MRDDFEKELDEMFKLVAYTTKMLEDSAAAMRYNRYPDYEQRRDEFAELMRYALFSAFAADPKELPLAGHTLGMPFELPDNELITDGQILMDKQRPFTWVAYSTVSKVWESDLYDLSEGDTQYINTFVHGVENGDHVFMVVFADDCDIRHEWRRFRCGSFLFGSFAMFPLFKELRDKKLPESKA